MATHILCEAQRKGLEAHIASLTDGCSQEIVRLQTQLAAQTEGYEKEVAQLRAETIVLADAKALPQEQSRQVIEGLTRQHAEAVEQLTRQHAETMARTKVENQEQIEKLMQQHEAEVLGLQSEIAEGTGKHAQEVHRLQAEIKSAGASKDTQLTALQKRIDDGVEEHADTMARIKAQHEDALVDLRSQLGCTHQAFVSKLSLDHRAEISTAKTQTAGEYAQQLQEREQKYAQAQANVDKLYAALQQQLEAIEEFRQEKGTLKAEAEELRRALQQAKTEHGAMQSLLSLDDAAHSAAVERNMETKYRHEIREAELKAQRYEHGTYHMMQSLSTEKQARADFETARTGEVSRLRSNCERKISQLESKHKSAVRDIQQRLDVASKEAILVHLCSTAFKAEPTYAVLRSDSLKKLAAKLEKDVNNLSIYEMELGVKCNIHHGAVRKFSAGGSGGSEKTLDRLGVKNGDVIGYARHGKPMHGERASAAPCGHLQHPD